MGSIAIIGAAGFVGSRLIETCMLTGIRDIYPIVRHNYSLVRLCRYGLQDRVRFADAENEKQLLEAIKGCPLVVNLTSGDPYGIIKSTKVIHNACVKAGVKRLIHLSSAVVYGQVKSPDVNDDSPLEKYHWMPYARAKIDSEHFLQHVCECSDPEIVVLRPGIVWGPRSRWSFNASTALKNNTAFLVGDGMGICNTIYIDNLVACILECCAYNTDVSGFFNIADNEVVTWRDFYASIAEHLGYDMSRMHKVLADRFEPTVDTLLHDIKSSAFYLRLKKSISLEKRAMIKQWLAVLKSQRNASSASDSTQETKLFVSREMWNLQKTCHKLPTSKFAKKFNFVPPVSFHDGTRMTIKWLNFLEYDEENRAG